MFLYELKKHRYQESSSDPTTKQWSSAHMFESSSFEHTSTEKKKWSKIPPGVKNMKIIQPV